MKRKKHFTPQQRAKMTAQIAELVSNGNSLSKICKSYNITPTTYYSWSKKYDHANTVTSCTQPKITQNDEEIPNVKVILFAANLEITLVGRPKRISEFFANSITT